MTPGAHRLLTEMTGGEEVVCESRECWIGLRQTTWAMVRQLIGMMAISKTSAPNDSFQRFAINDTGRHILARPELENEIYEAVRKRKPFTITEGHKVERI